MEEHGRVVDQMPGTIGRYQVLESIGYGAMGAVYKAFDPLIKRTLAIKTIRLDIPRNSAQYKSFIDRFYHEARISGTLSHPNIVTLFDIGEESGLPYLAMEFVEGQTISNLIEEGTRFKPEKVIGLVSQVASAVDYAHSKGVIHRDIKPSNLILYDAERVKVTDFGIAKLVDAEMTQAGTLLGTPAYMSPEQAMGEKLDGRSDIFSLGVCAFEMLSGEQPFAGPNITAILYKLVHVDPVEPANLEMSGLIPQKWREVFGKVLAKRPDDRYQTATEFVQDLEYCLGSWFGGVGETIAEDSPVAVRAIAEAAAAAATPPPAHEEVTHAMPAVSEPAAPAVAAPVAVAAPPAEAEYQATMVMEAGAVRSPAAEPEAEGTLLISAPAMPAAPGGPLAEPVESTMLMPAAAVAPAAPADSTVLMPSPTVAAPARVGEEEASATMVMPGLKLAGGPVRPRPEAPPREDAGATMLVPAATVPRPEALRPPAPMPPPRPPAAPPAEVAAPPKAVPAPRKGAPKGALLGFAATVLVLAVAAGIFFMKRGATSTEEAAPPTTVAAVTPPGAAQGESAGLKGSLTVTSQPAGATVSIDGQSKGVTPLQIGDLPMGAHEVRLELSGFAPGVQKIVLSAEAPRSELQVALAKAAEPSGTAEITSQPPGAVVKIDGVPTGHTPFTNRLSPGTHTVEVAKEGYEPWSGSLDIKDGKKVAVHAWLKGRAAVTVAPPPPPPAAASAEGRVHAPSEVDTPARKISGSAAAPALKSGQTVSLLISFVVGVDGTVSDITIVESGGPEVDKAMIKAVRGWKYAPAVKNGAKVRMRVTFKQSFRAR